MLYFDVGANHGRWTEANLSEGTRIVAVEASPATFATLQRVVGTKATLLNAAVCNSTTPTVPFYHCGTCDGLSTLNQEWLSHPRSRFANSQYSAIEVSTVTLDTLIAQYGVPDLLKIDVEGAEHMVIQSLTSKVPLLCFEWAAEWRQENSECLDYLVSLGFTRFHVQREDRYDYRPQQFELDAGQVKQAFAAAVDRQDWGMCWCQ
jgi:FkbM family methyltransferase